MTPFLKSYLTCALWSSTDNADGSGGEPLDRNYSISDIAPESLAKAQADCEAFQRDNTETLALAELTDERAGHCLWLNRNGHGSGFWDEYATCIRENYELDQLEIRVMKNKTCNCKYHACQRLSDASKAMGGVDVYVGDDGQLHFS